MRASIDWGKWKTQLIFHQMIDTRRFNELRRMIPEITPRMLTLQLRELESWELVSREVYQDPAKGGVLASRARLNAGPSCQRNA